MNTICVTGNLTRDPELRKTKSGMAVCTLTVASNYVTNKEKRTDYFNVTLFGRTAEVITQYCGKGIHVEITGSIHSRKYTDKAGMEKTLWEIIGDKCDFLGGKRDETSVTESPRQALSDTDVDEDLPF